MDTTAIIPIPIDQLIVSAHNARKIDRAPLDSLAASILAEGLLQNLTVIEGDVGTYQVIAGKRRLGALKLLRERGELPETLAAPPCRIVDDERALSASLAENIEREAMHPADEFVAFRRLFDSGRSIDEIAQQFGTLPIVVQRRLRLANVAPSLFELFRRDEISLDQMQALAITEDHSAQEAVWDAAKSSWERDPARLRQKLMGQAFNIARDKAARFAGAAALEAAGCIITRDLFSASGDGYTRDRQLVDELALGKLEAEAERVREEGWSWIEARVEFSAYDGAFGRIHPSQDEANLAPAERERLAALQAEAAEIENSDDGDEFSDEDLQRLAELEDEIGQLHERAEQWLPAQLAAAGAIVSIDYNGELEIHRGLVRPDARKAAKAAGGELIGGRDAKPKPAPEDLSPPMIERLGAHRTAMLRSATLGNRKVALAVLAHALLSDLFADAGRSGGPKPSRIDFPRLNPLEKVASELPMMRYHAEAAEKLDALRKRLPAPTKLLAWLLAAPADTVLDLLTAASACALDASIYANSKAHEIAVNEVAAALGIDYADHWEATRETFLGHVPRAAVEQAVREARGDADVAKLAGLKKDQSIDAAEELLAGRRWLPKPLRTPKPQTKPTAPPATPADAPAKKAKTATVESATPAAATPVRRKSKKTPAAAAP